MNSIIFKIFDKTFKQTNGIYELTPHQNVDMIQIVKNNCEAIIKDLKGDHLLIRNDVHGAEVIDADLIVDFSVRVEADAAVASKSGLILSVLSADCVPVLLGSMNEKVIGAAHCGWRSAKADILKETVALMRAKGADSIFAVIGPAIHQENYEVGQEFYDEIIATEPHASDLFKKSQNGQKWMFDLPGFIKLKLNKLEISHIIDLCEDTYSHPEKYYSYRRDIHLRDAIHQTNILSAIMIQHP